MLAHQLPPPKQSWLDTIAALPQDQREAVLAELTDGDAALLMDDWKMKARREQLTPPGDWRTWLIIAGRGFGKTRAGAEDIIAAHQSELCEYSGIIGATNKDVRRYCLEGPSGILSIAPNHFRPIYKKQDQELIWPNGSKSLVFSAEESERLRGPNFTRAWCDELASWHNGNEIKIRPVWDMLKFCMRMGVPQTVITTTPKPIKLIKELVVHQRSVVTGGKMSDNIRNLALSWVEDMQEDYSGTRLGRQELDAEILLDVEGAMWGALLIDACRIDIRPANLRRIGVAVDPAISSKTGADLTGIIGGGVCQRKPSMGYILADRSLRGTPQEWATAAVTLYHEIQADIMIAEKNQGGEMVMHTIHSIDDTVNVKLVTATRGKVLRAEPIHALYEQKRIKHVGSFPDLETQMCEFVPGELKKSPDRVDAMVHLFAELMPSKASRAGTWGRVAVAA